MLRAWVEGVMAQSQKGPLSSLYRVAMFLPSYGYRAVIQGRHLFYDTGLIRTHEVDAPVISVGNIICGGVGKTQVVALIAQKLVERGYKVGIVSRGYKRKTTHPLKVLPATMNAEECGDEPLMLAKRFPNMTVVASKDRVQGAKLALAAGACIIILDDGMQHRRLHRDLEIVVVQGEDPYASHSFIPQGTLRDLPHRLSNADLVVSVGPLMCPIDVPHIEVAIQPTGLFNGAGTSLPIPKRVGIFCGIGHPQRFINTVKAMGCTIVSQLILSDHEKISRSALNNFAHQACLKGAERILCTEKDWVKGIPYSKIPVGWLRTDLQVVKGAEILDSILSRKWI